ncbi:MAG TPA: Asp-tRNA(Asn)/Glu-tRNA(Gln) amidotransferase subunit GatC [Burkholderiaceae bacterium]|nr:Asp-tRNA(Asn)/Glu-tRNA(Gln) amidotransferase subunit GatC [Burkholderiaceae bacterium]
MSLSLDDVRRLAELSRLALTDDEAQRGLAQLNDVLALIERLQSVDTTGVEPMTHAQPMTLRLRADVPTEPDRRDEYQQVAPAVERGLYLVPRVVE